MATVEPIAPTIDFEALLRPIEGEKPSGESMQYSGLYDEIREARRADDPTLAEGWQSEVKASDYRKVIEVATSALTSQTKDIQVCVWFCEALIGQHGFAGFRDGLQLIRRIEEDFWETFHPEIDEGDMEARANAIDWMNGQVTQALKRVSLTAGEKLSFNDWEEAMRFDFPDNIESLDYEAQEKANALKTQAEAENRKTGTIWRKAKSDGNRAFYETLNLTLQECAAELTALDKINDEKFARNQTPSVTELRKILDSISTVVSKIVEEKRQLEPDEVDSEATEEVVGEDGEVKKGPAVATGAIQSRQDALKRLADIAEYFRKTEPNSPIPALLQRAVKWGNMPFESLIRDLISDSGSIEIVRQTLGFNTVTDSTSEE